MAVTAQIQKRDISMMLNNGVSPTGTVRTVKLPIASFVSKTADLAKAYAIVNAVENILAKSVYVVQLQDTSWLVNE